MYTEDNFIMISALQHYLFCPRQCALIHMEQAWSENLFTAQGHLMHESVHSGKFEKRDKIIRARGLWISSARLGLSGQADLVEFHKTNVAGEGIQLQGYPGRWRAFPVEFKRGKPKADRSDDVQLCAQALCLEEMLDTRIGEGAIFYGKNKRRHPVVFNETLRDLTEKTTLAIHALFESGSTPTAKYAKKCKSCSLYQLCMPKTIGRKGAVSRYLDRIVTELS